MLGDLIATPGVVETALPGSCVGIMALHGGLEAGTAELAAGVAGRTGAALYAIVQPDDHRWHIPSARHDPRESRALAAFLDQASLVLSIHGFGRPGLEDSVLIGGGNRMFAQRVGAALRRHTALPVVDDIAAIPSGLRGLDPANPVNLTARGGAQVELSPGARSPSAIAAIEDALVSVAANEARSLCVTAGGAPGPR